METSDIQIWQRATAELAAARAVIDFLTRQFIDKYNLQQGDRITNEGNIVRLSEQLSLLTDEPQ